MICLKVWSEDLNPVSALVWGDVEAIRYAEEKKQAERYHTIGSDMSIILCTAQNLHTRRTTLSNVLSFKPPTDLRETKSHIDTVERFN